MKKVLNVAIAGKGFVIDEDAYAKLNNYLEKFKSSANMGYQSKELMEDIEERIAELFSQHITARKKFSSEFFPFTDCKLVAAVVVLI